MTAPAIRIDPATMGDLHRLCSLRERETGGLLIGCRLANLPIVLVSDIIETPDEHATESTWTLRVAGANRLLEHRLRDEPVGSVIGYVGTWHTHPAAIPEPSSLDIETFAADSADDLTYSAMVIASAGDVLTGMVGGRGMEPTEAVIERLL